MKKIKFTVLTNIYYKDKPEYVQEALNSIYDQTLKADELILVIDGEIPNELEEVVRKNKNKIDKIIRLESNQGLGLARRRGVLESSYDYVAIMDSDDVAVENRFEMQVLKFLEDETLDIVGGQIEEFDNVTKEVIGKRIVPLVHLEIVRYMKKRCPLNHVTVMFKKNKVLEAGNYEELHFNEDFYLWIRMYLANAKFSNLSETLVNVRVDKETYNRRGGMKYYKSEKEVFRFMKKNKIINFCNYLSAMSKRFILQVLLPNKLRGYIFRKFARKK